jgi:hypothetical protein
MLLQILLQVQPPKEFFTAQSITTFTGASAAVWVLSNLARVIFKKNSTIPCFVISLIVAYLGAYITHSLDGVVSYFLGFLNGALLFFTAVGVQGFANAAGKGELTGETKLQSAIKVKFLTPWY